MDKPLTMGTTYGIIEADINQGGFEMLSKLKSRKFILAVVGGLLIILNQGLDLNLPEGTILAFAGLLASYLIGQSVVDATKNGK